MYKFKKLILITLALIFNIQAAQQINPNFTTIKTDSESNPAKRKLWALMEKEVNSITDGLGTPIDLQIKDMVIVLNLLGIKTSGSCQGHSGHGTSAPWVDIDIEDQRQEVLREKAFEIFEKVKKKEAALQKQNPDMHLREIVDDELIDLYKKSHIIQDHRDALDQSKLKKINELLSKFYSQHSTNHDCILFIEYLGFAGRLTNIGHNQQVIRDKKSQEAKLKEYQNEMQSFSNFLKNYYWTQFKVDNLK